MTGAQRRPDQRLQGSFETPPRHEIPEISRGHVEMLESTDDPALWTMLNMEYLVLRTIGRRSGREHKVALPFWIDLADQRLVVASFAGAHHHPAWFLNLTDPLNAEVQVRVREGTYWAHPVTLTGEERQRNWDALLADRPFYADYQQDNPRELPLVRLEELRTA